MNPNVKEVLKSELKYFKWSRIDWNNFSIFTIPLGIQVTKFFDQQYLQKNCWIIMVSDKKIDIQRLKELRPIVLDTCGHAFPIKYEFAQSYLMRPKATWLT